MGRKSGPAMDSSHLVEGSACAPSSQPSKTMQDGSSLWSGTETGKTMVGNGSPDLFQFVFTKDNVLVHPTRNARERIIGLLRLTKQQGSSLIMTWTPLSFDSSERRGSKFMRTAEKEAMRAAEKEAMRAAEKEAMRAAEKEAIRAAEKEAMRAAEKEAMRAAEKEAMRTAEKDGDLYAIRSVSLAEMRSIRRHTPPIGLQYIIIVLKSGLSFPPLYFHTGGVGVKEFFATLRNHALLVRSIDDPSVYFVDNVHDVQHDVTSQSFCCFYYDTNQEKENKANEEDKEKEKELEQKKEKKLGQEERYLEKKIAEGEAANSVGAGRYGELVYGTQNGFPALVCRRFPPPLSRPPPPLYYDHMGSRRFSSLDNEVQVVDPEPVRWPDITYNHSPPRKRYRRAPKDLPTLPPADNITLKFTATQPTILRDITTIDKKVRFPRDYHLLPPENTALDFTSTQPTMVRNTTKPRKCYRRSPRDLPTLPSAENITLTFTPAFTPRFCPISGRHPRKTVDLVLSPVEEAASIPVDRRYRKTFDLVLSPEANRVNVSPVVPHTSHSFVGSSIISGQNGIPATFASAVVESEVPSLLRTLEEDVVQSLFAGRQDWRLSQSPLLERLSDDAAPSNTVQGVSRFHRLYCSGSFSEGVALPISWRSRLHLAELSGEGGALARRRMEWWSGTSLSASVATGIPCHVIRLLFTSELFTHLMVDSGLTYKALNALKYIDKFGILKKYTDKLGILKHVTSGDVCQYLKTFFSKAIRNRLRWQRMGGVVVDSAQPLATSMILPYEQRPGVQQPNNVQLLQQQCSVQQRSNVQPPQQQSGVSEENVNREKHQARRWVQRSARKALREVFEDWGYREITPDETLALAAQFQGNPDAMQIMQLFRNWAQQKRRKDRDADGTPNMGRGGCRRKRKEAASQTQDVQQPVPHVKKRSVGEVSCSTSLQSESQTSTIGETAFKVDPRGVLRQVFEDRGCREITLGEAIALSIGFQGNPSATQVQQLFGEWAKQHQMTKLLDETARQEEDARQAHLYRKKLPVKKPLMKKLPVVTSVPANSPQSKSQPTIIKDTTSVPPAVEESSQLITERQALIRSRLLEESARHVEAVKEVYGHTMKPFVPIIGSGCSSLQSESQSSMEYTPPGPPALEDSRWRVQGSSKGGRHQSRPSRVSLPVTL